jgi:hypothetical protein
MRARQLCPPRYKACPFDHSKARVSISGINCLRLTSGLTLRYSARSLQIYRLHAVFSAIWIRLDCRRARAARRFERNGVGFNNQNDDGVAAGHL